jgi:hypothetical protein
MKNEAKRPTCQISSNAASHSRPEDNPEMFTVYLNGGGRRGVTACLAHAAQSEQRGHRVEIILT